MGKWNQQKTSCLNCIHWSPFGGGKTGMVSSCAENNNLWAPEKCITFKLIDRSTKGREKRH